MAHDAGCTRWQGRMRAQDLRSQTNYFDCLALSQVDILQYVETTP